MQLNTTLQTKHINNTHTAHSALGPHTAALTLDLISLALPHCWYGDVNDAILTGKLALQWHTAEQVQVTCSYWQGLVHWSVHQVVWGAPILTLNEWAGWLRLTLQWHTDNMCVCVCLSTWLFILAVHSVSGYLKWVSTSFLWWVTGSLWRTPLTLLTTLKTHETAGKVCVCVFEYGVFPKCVYYKKKKTVNSITPHVCHNYTCTH